MTKLHQTSAIPLLSSKTAKILFFWHYPCYDSFNYLTTYINTCLYLHNNLHPFLTIMHLFDNLEQTNLI
jgi:hypothetical protein